MNTKTSELNCGDLAPDFSSNSTKGHVSLGSYYGKTVVIYFYPKDMTSGCIVQAQEFMQLYDEFKKFDTVVLGVSKDDLSSHKKFCEQERIDYPLLSDIDGKLCNKYGVMQEKLTAYHNKAFTDFPLHIEQQTNKPQDDLVINRTTFLIGKDKRILKIWRNVKPLGHAQRVLDSIKISNLVLNLELNSIS